MWLADFLFGAKKFKFTSLPKDDPPDGSMQFASWPVPPYELLPSNFLYYEFGPNCGESNPLPLIWASKLSKPCVDLAKC